MIIGNDRFVEERRMRDNMQMVLRDLLKDYSLTDSTLLGTLEKKLTVPILSNLHSPEGGRKNKQS